MYPEHFGRNKEKSVYFKKFSFFKNQTREEDERRKDRLLSPWGWEELSSSAGVISRSLEKPSMGFWKRLGRFRRLFIKGHLLNVWALRGQSWSVLSELVPP